jgi:hypothetical protein
MRLAKFAHLRLKHTSAPPSYGQVSKFSKVHRREDHIASVQKIAQMLPPNSSSGCVSIASVKFPSSYSAVQSTAGHLTHPRIRLSLPFRHQDRQEGLGCPSEKDMRCHHRGHSGPGSKRGFPGQRGRIHRGRGHMVGCRPGVCVCGPGRHGGETLDPPGGVRSAICRNFESAKTIFKFDDATATKFLIHPLFTGCTNWPRLKKARTRRAARPRPSAPIAASQRRPCAPWTRSRATPEQTRTRCSCARRALPGAPPHVFLRRNIASPCARTFHVKKFKHHDFNSRHVCSFQALLSSCSLNRRTYTPKVSSARLSRAPLYPSTPSFDSRLSHELSLML